MSGSPSVDYTFWTFIVGIATLIILALSVLAQYLGLFGGKLKIPVGQMVLVFQNSGGIIGGKVAGNSAQSVTLTDASYVKEEFFVGTAEPNYFPSGRVGEADIPMSSIMRWKKFPDGLSKAWDATSH